jgi:hypothetical protein
VPLGEADLEPMGEEVDAKREETEAFEVRYGKEDIEEAINWASVEVLTLGNLNEEAPLNGAGGSAGKA